MSKKTQTILFLIALTIQIFIVASVPLKQLRVKQTGKTVLIKTAPYDPYDFLSGYYMRLNFEISNADNFGQTDLDIEEQREKTVYSIIQKGENDIWHPLRITVDKPEELGADAIFIKGKLRYGRIKYGIEKFYIPETERETMADKLRQNSDDTLVKIKIDRKGNPVLESLIIAGTEYR